MTSKDHPASSDVLFGAWRHSHEEDVGQVMVFRGADFPFPPSRGRVGFQLEPEGEGRYFPIGRDDRERQQACTWELTTDDLLILHDRVTGASLFQGRLIRREAGRLELSPVDDSNV